MREGVGLVSAAQVCVNNWFILASLKVLLPVVIWFKARTFRAESFSLATTPAATSNKFNVFKTLVLQIASPSNYSLWIHQSSSGGIHYCNLMASQLELGIVYNAPSSGADIQLTVQ